MKKQTATGSSAKSKGGTDAMPNITIDFTYKETLKLYNLLLSLEIDIPKIAKDYRKIREKVLNGLNNCESI